MNNINNEEIDNLAIGSRFKIKGVGLSMSPVILPGDILHLEVVSSHSLRLGEIAVFKHKGKLIAHRVVDKDLKRKIIIEKGDKKFQPYEIPFESIIGKVVAIERNDRVKPQDGGSNRIINRIIAHFSYNKFKLIMLLSRLIKKKAE